MNKKYVGLLAILPLAFVALSPSLIGEANAVNVGSQDVNGRPGYQPDKVCGDVLCSNPVAFNAAKSKQESSGPSSAEFDALSIQYSVKTQEMMVAQAKGDSDKVEELQNELKILRDQINEWKNN